MHTDLVAALDIGGTKIAGALVDGRGRILVRAQRPTPAREDGETVMRAVAAVLGELTASPLWEGVSAVGIGSAGPVDASAGTVSPVNVPGWRDYPLVARVREAAGGLPVELIGDGVAITAAEHWQSAARGHDNEAIARELVVSVRTVERHLQNVYVKLDVQGKSARTAAVARLLTTA